MLTIVIGILPRFQHFQTRVGTSNGVIANPLVVPGPFFTSKGRRKGNNLPRTFFFKSNL